MAGRGEGARERTSSSGETQRTNTRETGNRGRTGEGERINTRVIEGDIKQTQEEVAAAVAGGAVHTVVLC